jgi:predicted GIY-YIG superfamily endonuclease
VPARKHHHVYVIELDPAVWEVSARFRRANPQRLADRECLYVGMTGLTPEKRFANHRAGVRSSRLVHRFAKRLRPDLYEGVNPMTYREAARMEQVLAKVLRSDGYGVWQN